MGLLRELYRRWLIARHRPRHWQLRPDTIDRRIFRHVVIDNEYRLPDRFDPADLILDIGAHTGSFALAALRRGAGRVVCCEPDADNFELLAHNLTPYRDRVALLHLAVWRSDKPTRSLSLANPLDRRNTGAGRVCVKGEQRVDVRAFDDLVDDVLPAGGRLRLVKLDCEGAEWPILLTSRRLDRIDTLCGEYHLGELPPLFHVEGRPAPGLETLRQVLTEQGFQVEAGPDPRSPYPLGQFFAIRSPVVR